MPGRKAAAGQKAIVSPPVKRFRHVLYEELQGAGEGTGQRAVLRAPVKGL